MITAVIQKRGLIRYLEPAIGIGLWLWLAIFNVLQHEQYTWSFYFLSLTLLAPTQLPALAFNWYKAQYTPNLSVQKLRLYELVCYFICLPLCTLLAIAIAPKNFDSFFFIYAALASIGLALLLNANSYYQNKMKHYKWIQQLSLENAVLISLFLIALTLAIMGVSSLNNPAYDQKDQLLIGFEFSLRKIIANFGTFISFFSQFLFMYLTGYLFFYINNRLLVAKILRQKGLLLYILSLLTTVGLLFPLMSQMLILLPINERLGRAIFSFHPFDLENAFGVIGIMLFSLPIVLSLQWGRQNTKILSLEQQKSQTELSLLRQQLNPHFFFNTLNNLYALSLQKSDQTSESILQLSALMRYTIYKGSEEKVKLEEELAYIKDYISLQQIRLKKTLKFSFEHQINDAKLTIAPLLLIVLIENAFKHGIEPAEQAAFLKLKLVATGTEINFSCENSLETTTADQTIGIGLDNLRKRLALLYPNRYVLQMSQKPGSYLASLQLKNI